MKEPALQLYVHARTRTSGSMWADLGYWVDGMAIGSKPVGDAFDSGGPPQGPIQTSPLRASITAHARFQRGTSERGPAEEHACSQAATDSEPTTWPETKPESECLRILIVDDHRTFSELLAGAIDREPDLKSVGTARTVECAVPMFRNLRPDVIIMDLYLADGSGLKASERILSEAPKTRIVMLTGNPSQGALQEAARMGICGFLPKDGSLGIMLDTLRHARPGNMIVHPSLIARLGNTAASVPEPAGT
jgi:ActR/RegA family two-component response regulator